MSKYIIFAYYRTGSTNLCALLGTARGKRTLHEPFSFNSGDKNIIRRLLINLSLYDKFWNEFYRPNLRELDFHPFNKAEVKTYLDSIFKEFEGIKHIWNISSYALNLFILDYFMERNYKIIFLQRDFLNSEVSNLLAKEIQIFQLSDSSMDFNMVIKKKEKIDSFKFSPLNAGAIFNNCLIGSFLARKLLNFISNYPYLLIRYEELFGEEIPWPEKIKKIKSICSYLEIDFKSLSEAHVEHFLSPMLKQNPEYLYNKVSNWEEIKKTYEDLKKHLES